MAFGCKGLKHLFCKFLRELFIIAPLDSWSGLRAKGCGMLEVTSLGQQNE